MTNKARKLVCVNGASGFIASWKVKFLLQRGYTFRTTVRDPSRFLLFLTLPLSSYLIRTLIQWLYEYEWFYLVQVTPRRLTTCLNLMVQRRGCTSSRQTSWKKFLLTLLLRAVTASFILFRPLISLRKTHRSFSFHFCMVVDMDY